RSSAPSSTLFPYTTLFRSGQCQQVLTVVQKLLAQVVDRWFQSLHVGLKSGRDLKNGFTGGNDSCHTSRYGGMLFLASFFHDDFRSEEHTSELQSRENLVCR